MHTWLLELAKELQERIAEDREEHARLPRLLTVVRCHAGVLSLLVVDRHARSPPQTSRSGARSPWSSAMT